MNDRLEDKEHGCRLQDLCTVATHPDPPRTVIKADAANQVASATHFDIMADSAGTLPTGSSGSPTDFLRNVVGQKVVVRLNSGVDYRGASHHWYSSYL